MKSAVMNFCINLICLMVLTSCVNASLLSWSYGPKFYTSQLHDITAFAGFDTLDGMIVSVGDFNSDKLYLVVPLNI
jgi:hypothetical protein